MQQPYTRIKKLLGNICCSLLLSCIGFTAYVNAAPFNDTLVLDGSNNDNLNKHLYVLEKKDKVSAREVWEQTPEQQFTLFYPQKIYNSGVADHYVWLVFSLKNNTGRDETFYFQLNYPGVNLAQLFLKSDTTYRLIGQAGITLPFKERPYNNYDIIFPLHLQKGASHTYMVMVDKYSESFNMMPRLLDRNTLKSEEQRLYLMFGMITGIMLINIVINLFLYISLREKVHLYYSLYVITMIFWLYANETLDFQFFFPDYPIITTISEFIATGLGLIAMSYLIISFLELTRSNSHFKIPILIFRYILMLLLPLSVVAFIIYKEIAWFKEWYLYGYLFVGFVITVLFIAAAIERAIQKYKPAWFYLAACAYLAFAIGEYCLFLIGVPMGTRMKARPNDVQIGLIIESILIFLGIIYRFNLYRREKEALLLQLNRQQQEMTEQVIEVQEEERKRIAQDLHDDVGATLSTLLLHISNIPEEDKLSQKVLQSFNEKSIDISKKALADLRLIAHNLLPKDFSRLGLFTILQNRVDELNSYGNISFKLLTDGNTAILDDVLSITIYRIINELINNIVKHSLASSAIIQLAISQENIMLITEDDGIGIKNNMSVFGIGLKNIESRVEHRKGTFNIDSNTTGTTIIIEIPVNHFPNDNT